MGANAVIIPIDLPSIDVYSPGLLQIFSIGPIIRGGRLLPDIAQPPFRAVIMTRVRAEVSGEVAQAPKAAPPPTMVEFFKNARREETLDPLIDLPVGHNLMVLMSLHL
jgi:hypothetical protein